MRVQTFPIEGLLLFIPKIHHDSRGCFLENFRHDIFLKAIDAPNYSFVQSNISRSNGYCLRGLHYQTPPYAQGKLVQILKGKIFDVAVDIRPQSKTFGQWQGVILSDKEFQSFFIPAGFAHGFLSLQKDSEILYQVSDYYTPSVERTISWDDKDLNIRWPLDLLEGQAPIISDKDNKGDSFAHLKSQLMDKG